MADTPPLDSEYAWCLMPPMEQAFYGTMLALHIDEADSGVTKADTGLAKLRILAGVRSRLPEPEYEAARAGFNIEYEDFATWYLVQYRIRHGFDRGYKQPTPDQIQAAYERYGRGTCDYY